MSRLNNLPSFIIAFFLIIIIQITNCNYNENINGQSNSQVPVFREMTCGTERTDIYCHGTTEMLSQLTLLDNVQKYQYETIDMVFDGGYYNITPTFFKDVNVLFKRNDQMKEFRVKFQNFEGLFLYAGFFKDICGDHRTFDDEDISKSKCHITLNVYNSKASDFVVSPRAFEHLKANSFTIHNSHFNDLTFQQLFQRSKINTLDLKGTYVDVNQHEPFEGSINKVILTKQASNLDPDEFPLFPVDNYVINAQNIQSINKHAFGDKYKNVKELSIKSKPLVIMSGDLEPFGNLKKLFIDDATIDKGSLSHLNNLEELVLGPDTVINSLADLNTMNNLKIINIEQPNDVRLLCDMATAISQSKATFKIPLLASKCTCEHKFVAHLRNQKNDACYNYSEECNKTPCEVVNSFFGHSDKYDTTSVVMMTDAKTEEDIPMKEQEDDTSDGSIKNIGDKPIAKSSKMNWLPIVIVVSILLLITICGVMAYFLRSFYERRREFKPIPQNSDQFNANK